MRFTETINGYNAMGREDAEYEACYAIAEHHTVGGLHCHDFYEFYIHYQGGKVYYVDGSVFPLQNNQLIIMPPFRMHGLVGGSSLQNYERGFLYLRPETLFGSKFESYLNQQHKQTDKLESSFDIDEIERLIMEGKGWKD